MLLFTNIQGQGGRSTYRLEVAHDGTLGHGANGEHVANGKHGLLAAVHKLRTQSPFREFQRPNSPYKYKLSLQAHIVGEEHAQISFLTTTVNPKP